MNGSPNDGDDGDGFPRSPGPAGGDDPPVSVETLFDILSKPRCRFVLSHLERSPADVAELDDLAERVADREAAESDEDSDASDTLAASDDRCQRVAVALHHSHLPQLSETPLLDYDPRSKTVRYWGDDRIVACLDALRSADDRE